MRPTASTEEGCRLGKRGRFSAQKRRREAKKRQKSEEKARRKERRKAGLPPGDWDDNDRIDMFGRVIPREPEEAPAEVGDVPVEVGDAPAEEADGEPT